MTTTLDLLCRMYSTTRPPFAAIFATFFEALKSTNTLEIHLKNVNNSVEWKGVLIEGTKKSSPVSKKLKCLRPLIENTDCLRKNINWSTPFRQKNEAIARATWTRFQQSMFCHARIRNRKIVFTSLCCGIKRQLTRNRLSILHCSRCESSNQKFGHHSARNNENKRNSVAKTRKGLKKHGFHFNLSAIPFDKVARARIRCVRLWRNKQ